MGKRAQTSKANEVTGVLLGCIQTRILISELLGKNTNQEHPGAEELSLEPNPKQFGSSTLVIRPRLVLVCFPLELIII